MSMSSLEDKNRFIATDVANLQAQRLLGRINLGVPEVFGLLSVENNVAELVYLFFRVAMPLAFCGCAVNGKVLYGFQAFVADGDGIELFLFVGTHVLGVEVTNLLHHAVADKLGYPDVEPLLFCRLSAKFLCGAIHFVFCLVGCHHIVELLLQVAQLHEIQWNGPVFMDELVRYNFFHNPKHK